MLSESALLGLLAALIEPLAQQRILEFLEYCEVKFAIDDGELNDRIGLNILAHVNGLADFVDLADPQRVLLLPPLALHRLPLPLVYYRLHCKVYFPEYALDKVHKHKHVQDVDEAVKEHDISVELRSTSDVVIDHSGPSGLIKNGNVIIQSGHISLPITKLLIELVGRVAVGLVEVVEELHGQDGEEMEEEYVDEEEVNDDGHDLEAHPD